MKALVIARLTFWEAVRKKMLLGAVVMTLGFLALFALGSYFAFREMERLPQMPAYMKTLASSQLLLSGLYVTNFIGGLLAILTAVGTISGEVDQGTLHTIVPKPMSRWEIVAGKWLGFAGMLSTYIIVTSLMVIGIVYVLGHYLPHRPWESIALMALETLLLLSLTLLGSTFFSTVANGIVILILYATATVGGMVEQLGSLLENSTMMNIGVITSLVIPSDVLWKLASYWLQGGATVGIGPMGPFAVLNPPSLGMVAYALVYLGAALGAAAWVFSGKDL